MTRILVVEDEPIQCANLTHALKQEGYRVQAATSPDEAIGLARWFRPQILVVDWMLETDCDGMCLMRRLRRTHPDLRTILSTGYPLGELEDECGSESRLEILQKPYLLAELLESVRALSREIESGTVRRCLTYLNSTRSVPHV